MGKAVTLEEARAAKEEARRQLADKNEVVGVGLTKAKGGYAVKVNLKCRPKEPVPQEVNGVPVIVDVVGEIRKL